MIESIKKYCDDRISEFSTISAERKKLLEKIAHYISSRKRQDQPVHLVYICTHNSRRSHFGQIWGHVAADYFNVSNVKTYSGGTEVTAFNPNAVKAFERIGFTVQKITQDQNPLYHLFHSKNVNPIICFSKVFDHADNPHKDFAAIMVCSDAEENCPFVPGVDLRILTSYEDPKDFDGTEQQDAAYDERCKQIARETLYVLSKV